MHGKLLSGLLPQRVAKSSTKGFRKVNWTVISEEQNKLNAY